MKYRIRFNKQDNLYYFEGKFLWSKWKAIHTDSDRGLIVVRAQAYLYAKARVADYRGNKKWQSKNKKKKIAKKQ